MTDMLDRLSASVGAQFRIEREVGSGGMATVYLAHDTKHDRDVALKVLRPELAQSLGVERFLQEIRLVARLNHPNILPLLDSGDAGGLPYFIMPYVAGESLRARLQRETQLPVDEAIQIAREIADALTAAHAEGIVHRDIKPENVLLAGGKAVVADFGIARAVQAAGGRKLTESGLAVGTPTYMSPEQASADDRIDPRTDVYSLGCVLYEMLVGEPPFTGPSAQAITARKLTESAPRISAVRETVSPAVEQLVQKALARLPADRFGTAQEFATALSLSAGGATARKGLWNRLGAYERVSVPKWGVWAAATALVVSLLYIASTRRSHAPAELPRALLSVPLHAGDWIGGIGGNLVAISPDAQYFAWATPNDGATAAPNLRLRRIDGLDVAPIGDPGNNPFFSPDGQWLGFFTGGRLAKTPVSGGPVLSIVPAEGLVRGAAWGEDVIVYAAGPEGGLMVVPAEGGTPTRLTVPDTANGVIDHRWPEMLPDDSGVLFTIWTGDLDQARVAVARLPSGETTVLAEPGFSPRYVRATGQVAWSVTSGSILTASFDAQRFVLDGPALPSLEGVWVEPSGTAAYSIADDGTVLFFAGREAQQRSLLSVDTTGRATSLIEERANFMEPRVSPDGRRVALAEGLGGRYDIHVYDLASGTRQTLTNQGWNRRPAWSPDGNRVLFVSRPTTMTDGDRFRLFDTDADGRSSPSVMVERGRLREGVWTPDGSTIVFTEGEIDSADIGMVRVGSRDSLEYLVRSPGWDIRPSISPDGQWLAYMSNELGKSDIYVAAFPEGRPRVRISRDGGREPAWCRSADELFYLNAADQLTVASLEFEPTLNVRARRTLFDARPYAYYDVFPDCDRFLAVLRAPEPLQELVLALHWYQRSRNDRP